MLKIYEENDIDKIGDFCRKQSKNCRDFCYETKGRDKYYDIYDYCPPLVYIQGPPGPPGPRGPRGPRGPQGPTTVVTNPCVINDCCNPCDPCYKPYNPCDPCYNICDPCYKPYNPCDPCCKPYNPCDPCYNVCDPCYDPCYNVCDPCCNNVCDPCCNNVCDPCNKPTYNRNICVPASVPCRKPVAATFVSKNHIAISLLGNTATVPLNFLLGGGNNCSEGLILDPVSGTVKVCYDGLYQIYFAAKLTFAVGAGVSLVVNGEEILPITAFIEVGELSGHVVMYLKSGDTVKLALTGFLSVDIKITGVAGLLTLVKIS